MSPTSRRVTAVGRDTILLFFQDYEVDRFVPGDRYLKRLVRPLYSRLRHRPGVTGFSLWFSLLERALREAGMDVRVNDRAAARDNPDHPVGLVGYPHLLDGWDLPNPAVLGPSLFDHPNAAPDLMRDPRFVTYLVTCDWMDELFAPAYGREVVGSWYAGIDLTAWPDVSAAPKRYDVLVYDKIRWNRDDLETALLGRVLAELDRRGLRSTVIRYQHYDHAAYRRALRESRSMIFLCEHETQGMAYQEAMASGLPVLAWDQGFWLDPQRLRRQADPVRATSVPYFDDRCGLRFRGPEDFPDRLEAFWSRVDEFRPREFVREQLSFAGSAARYLTHYRAAAAAGVRGA